MKGVYARNKGGEVEEVAEEDAELVHLGRDQIETEKRGSGGGPGFELVDRPETEDRSDHHDHAGEPSAQDARDDATKDESQSRMYGDLSHSSPPSS